MKTILENIEKIWWKTTDYPLESSCRTHVRTINSWRYVVSTHQMKGINVTTTIQSLIPGC